MEELTDVLYIAISELVHEHPVCEVHGYGFWDLYVRVQKKMTKEDLQSLIQNELNSGDLILLESGLLIERVRRNNHPNQVTGKVKFSNSIDNEWEKAMSLKPIEEEWNKTMTSKSTNEIWTEYMNPKPTNEIWAKPMTPKPIEKERAVPMTPELAMAMLFSETEEERTMAMTPKTNEEEGAMTMTPELAMAMLFSETEQERAMAMTTIKPIEEKEAMGMAPELAMAMQFSETEEEGAVAMTRESNKRSTKIEKINLIPTYDVSKWTKEQVYFYIRKYLYIQIAQKLILDNVDGEALLKVDTAMLFNKYGVLYSRAVKINALIERLERPIEVIDLSD